MLLPIYLLIRTVNILGKGSDKQRANRQIWVCAKLAAVGCTAILLWPSLTQEAAHSSERLLRAHTHTHTRSTTYEQFLCQYMRWWEAVSHCLKFPWSEGCVISLLSLSAFFSFTWIFFYSREEERAIKMYNAQLRVCTSKHTQTHTHTSFITLTDVTQGIIMDGLCYDRWNCVPLSHRQCRLLQNQVLWLTFSMS